MKSSWKRTSLVLAACLGILAGCGSGGQESAPPDGGVSADSSPGRQEESLLPSAPVKVVFWHSMTGAAAENIEATAAKYNETVGKEKGITISPVFQGAYDEASTKLTAVLRSGAQKDLPDIMQLSSKGIFDVKDSKFIVPVQSFIDRDPSGMNVSDLNQNALHYATYNGKVLGLPFSNSSIMLFYNKDHFRQAGLNPDEPPKTLEELARYANALKVKDGAKMVRYAMGAQLRFFLLGTWIPMQGENKYIFDHEDGRTGTPEKLAMTGDGTLKTLLTEWSKVLATGGVEYTVANPTKDFQAGLYSMIPAATSSMGNMTSVVVNGKLFDLGVAELPRVNSQSTSGTGIGGSAVYLFNRGNEDALRGAWDYLKYLATPEVSADWFMKTGYYPMNTKAMELSSTKDFMDKNPQYGIIQKITDNSKKYEKYLEPWTPSFTDMDKIVQDEIIRFSQGSQDIDKTVDTIEAKTNQLLKDWRSANP